MNEFELLAPVGSWDALVAAVQNGANAVYLGGKAFNARQNANNFDEEELKKAVEYCHVRDVKVFVTVNILVDDDELMELGNYLAFLYNIDVDAVIVQDLGVTKLLQDLLPDFEHHASTQMSIHNLEGVKWMEELGFRRVVLAREMRLEEIGHIAQNTRADLEVFVHGALCVCYSGQCLMSSMIGGRSGNRGRCAQPCRMPYRLVHLNTGKEMEAEEGNHLLSPKDLNTLENVDQILGAGVKSLKIEGRLKRPEYVATVVGAYRKAIDQYIADQKKPNIDEKTLKDVTQIFNRGFTKGYILGEQGKALMSFTKPSNRGIKTGVVIDYDKNKRRVRLKLEDSLAKGDGIEIWTHQGDHPGTIVEGIFYKGQKLEKGNAGETVEIPFKHPVAKGQLVYKTSDEDLLKRAKESYIKTEKGITLFGRFAGEIGEKITLDLWDEAGNHVHQQGEYIVEKAMKMPITQERIREQLMKLGNTPYALESVEVKIDGEAAIPVGELNRLRRDAIVQLDQIRADKNQRSSVNTKEFEVQLKAWMKAQPIAHKKSVGLRVTANNLIQLKAILNFEVERIYYTDRATLEEAMRLCKLHHRVCVPAFGRITDDIEMRQIEEVIESYKENMGFMAGNLGVMHLLKDKGVQKIFTDFSLNVFNSQSISLLKETKIDEVTLSPELTLKQIKKIVDGAALPCEVIVHGHLPLMVTKYCPVSATIGKGNEKENCRLCRNSTFGLKDRKNMVFPIMTDASCKTHILNSQSLCLIENVTEMVEMGIRNMRIQFTIEGEEEVKQILNAYTAVLFGGDQEEATKTMSKFMEHMREKGFTKGHFYRGVL